MPRRSRPWNSRPTVATDDQKADAAAAAERIVSRQANAPEPPRPRPRRDSEPRERRGEGRPTRNGGVRASRDGERRAQREGSLNDRIKRAGSEKIARTEQSRDAPKEPAREQPTKAAPALRMGAFRTASFGNIFSQPADTPATREAEVLRALEVPKESPGTLVIKPRKREIRIERGVRKVKKRVVMRGSKRITVDPRMRPVLERYGGDYTRFAPRSALSGLNKPRQPVAYARAALTLRPYLSHARREQALDVVKKYAREAQAVV